MPSERELPVPGPTRFPPRVAIQTHKTEVEANSEGSGEALQDRSGYPLSGKGLLRLGAIALESVPTQLLSLLWDASDFQSEYTLDMAVLTKQDLERTLQQLPLRELSVRVEGRPGHLVAEVSSPDFREQNEAVRQQKVWEFLVNTLTDEQRDQVEFVFTVTPEETQEAAA